MAERERTVAEVEVELKDAVERRARLREVRERVKGDLFLDADVQLGRLQTIDTSIAQCGDTIEGLMEERSQAALITGELDLLDRMLDEGRA